MQVLYSSNLFIILLISSCQGLTPVEGHGESLPYEESADNFEVSISTSGNLSAVLRGSEIVAQSVSRAPGITVTASEILTQPSPTSTESQISLQPASTDLFDTRFDDETLPFATPTASTTTLVTGEKLQTTLPVPSPIPTQNEMPMWPSSTVQYSTMTDDGIFSKYTSTNPSTVTQSEILSLPISTDPRTVTQRELFFPSASTDLATVTGVQALSPSTSIEPSTVTHSEVLPHPTSAESERLTIIHSTNSTNTPYVIGTAVGPLPNISLPTKIPSTYFEFATKSDSSDLLSLENVSERHLLTQHQNAASLQKMESVSQKSNALSPQGSKIWSTEAAPENAANTSPMVLMTAATWSPTTATSWQNEGSLSKPLRGPPIEEIVDSPEIDFLKEFQVPLSGGVTEVEGSHPLSSAFRLIPTVYLRKETGAVHPDGVPPEYSIIATFRMLGDTAQNVWNLWEVSDIEGREQVGIRFFGDSRTLDFFYKIPYNTVVFRTFTEVDILFDGSWHKLALSVSGKEAKLLIDCRQVNIVPISNHKAINGNGYTSIARSLLEDATVYLDLQQLELYRDPGKVFSEGCCELSDLCGRRAEYSFTENLSPCKCSHGQQGLQSNTSSQGARGNSNSYGRVGVTGPRPVAGIKGNKGVQRRPGQRGVDGLKRYKGLQGTIGFKGISGPPGPRGKKGPQGEKGNEGTPGQEGLWGLRGVKGEKGLPSIEGRPGVEGPRGLVGDPGFPGTKGTKGKLGVPGGSGTKGDSGLKGIPGDPGRPGRDGDPGIEAYQGPQGLKGLKGITGPKGEKGFPGPRGHEGPIGKPGPKGHKGIAGVPGWPGIVGYPGNQGHVGYPGPNGVKGDKGAKGIQGFEGLKGEKGEKGSKGEPGDKGDPGPRGLKGKRGPPGEPGDRGAFGERGITGDTGLPGFSGPTGPPGPILPASHVIEVCKRLVLEQMSLYTSMVRRKCINACPLYGDVPTGPPGPVGEKGQPGKSGRPGINGHDGEGGLEGFTGEPGDPGLQGLKGEHGDPGDQGPQGVGLSGFIGAQGSRGDRGKPGSSIPGQSGQQGPRGHTGRRGLRGYPGHRGNPGACKATGCD